MFIVKILSGKSFVISKSESILEAALKHGVHLPYSCRSGRCRACRCKIINGETSVLTHELGLTSEDQDENFILTCARGAKTDLLLDIEEIESEYIIKDRILPVRIKKLEMIATNILIVTLRLPNTSNFHYLAGQYVDVIGPAGIKRSYSLAKASLLDNELELHIKYVPGGCLSEYWFNQAKINDLLRINGPLGAFFIRPYSSFNLVFLATGTGIAPVKAMIEQISANKKNELPLSVSLYWGGRVIEDLYLDPLSWYSDLQFFPVLSSSDQFCEGRKGYVQNIFLNSKPDLSNTVVYACGSDAMIKSASKELISAGLIKNRFYADAFVASGV